MNWCSARLQHYMLDWHSGLDHFVLLLNTLFNFTDYNLKQDYSEAMVISVAQSCLNLCYPIDCSTPGFHVHHQLPEFTHVIESVMPSKHLIFYCPLLLLPSIFTSIRVSSNESVLCIRSFSFSISPSNEYSDWFPLGLTGLISLQSKGLSRAFSNTTVQKHQFFGAQFSLWSNSHIHTWPLEKP